MFHNLKEFAARLFFPYGSVRRVVRGPVSGMKYIVRPGMGVSYWLGRHSMDLEFLANQIRPGMTVYDIGANVGQSMLLFAKAVGESGRVLSFEPVPTLAESIVENAKLNGLKHVTVIQEAISDREGEFSFWYDDRTPTKGRLAELSKSHTHTVKCRTLDSTAASGLPAPHVIKIDVEGAGGAALRGASRTVQEMRPMIYIEFHNRDEIEAVQQCLVPVGYKCYSARGIPIENLDSPDINALWCVCENDCDLKQ